MAKKLTLRDYQVDIKQAARERYACGVKRLLMVMPTGAGKTVVFSDIAYDASNKGQYVLVLAHRIELLEQCGDKMQQNGVKFGYLNPKYTADNTCKVQVGTMQTVIRRLEQLRITPNLIIIDEAHRSMSATYKAIVEYYSGARLLGVTATPIRGDGKPLGDMYEDMVVGPQIAELIKRGALVDADTYGPTLNLDLSDVGMVAGDYNKKKLSAKMQKPGITGDAVQHYRDICPGAKSVVFCTSIKHAEQAAADFCSAGYKFVSVDGKMSSEERVKVLGRPGHPGMLETGEIDGVTSVDLVTEGWDLPALQCGIMLRPTHNVGLFIQMAGRIIRPFPGKVCGIMLDHAGLCREHGLISEHRYWSIDEEYHKYNKRIRTELEKPVMIQQCKKCFHTHQPSPVCPKCGNVYIIQGRVPEQHEGQLQKITPEMAERMKHARRTEIARAKTLDELKAIEKERGYKGRDPIKHKNLPVAGWAEQVFYSRTKKKNEFGSLN